MEKAGTLGIAAYAGGLDVNQMVSMSMNDFPVSILKTEDCCDSESHRPNLGGVGKADFSPLNVDAVGHLGSDDERDIFGRSFIVATSSKTRRRPIVVAFLKSGGPSFFKTAPSSEDRHVVRT